jgi:hypothetical protein
MKTLLGYLLFALNRLVFWYTIVALMVLLTVQRSSLSVTSTSILALFYAGLIALSYACFLLERRLLGSTYWDGFVLARVLRWVAGQTINGNRDYPLYLRTTLKNVGGRLLLIAPVLLFILFYALFFEQDGPLTQFASQETRQERLHLFASFFSRLNRFLSHGYDPQTFDNGMSFCLRSLFWSLYCLLLTGGATDFAYHKLCQPAQGTTSPDRRIAQSFLQYFVLYWKQTLILILLVEYPLLTYLDTAAINYHLANDSVFFPHLIFTLTSSPFCVLFIDLILHDIVLPRGKRSRTLRKIGKYRDGQRSTPDGSQSSSTGVGDRPKTT